jgi:hypothetical protein
MKFHNFSKKKKKRKEKRENVFTVFQRVMTIDTNYTPPSSLIDKMHLSFPTDLLHPSSASSSSSSRSPLREMAVSSLLVIFSSTLLLTILTLGWRILNWVWLRPKHLERQLREQGFSGNSYRLFFGDLKDNSITSKRASSKPINFSDDVTPRAIASVYHIVENYGT